MDSNEAMAQDEKIRSATLRKIDIPSLALFFSTPKDMTVTTFYREFYEPSRQSAHHQYKL
jgi:hypothetical protein